MLNNNTEVTENGTNTYASYCARRSKSLNFDEYNAMLSVHSHTTDTAIIRLALSGDMKTCEYFPFQPSMPYDVSVASG